MHPSFRFLFPSQTTHAAISKPFQNIILLVPLFFAASLSALHGASKPPTDPTNTPVGVGVLSNNTTGTNNTGLGYQALFSNTTGSGNTASGSQSLFNNTTASGNTADGFLALFSNTTGAQNTAVGSQALNFSTIGNENTASGSNALFNNTSGNDNTANGTNAAHNNNIGSFNTVNGASAFYFNTAGSFNVADGSFALNLSTGSNNIALGYSAGGNLTTGDFNIDIGNQGMSGESSTIRIGTDGNHVATFIAGIATTPVAGVPVVIDANGQLGIGVSSERFKAEIQPMDCASESILALKPVTFRYKDEVDRKGTQQFGLIAEEVAKIDPDLVVRDRDDRILTVRYEAVNAMLLNEFLKEHRKVRQQEKQIAKLATSIEEQKAALQTTVSRQQDEITKLAALVREQAAQIQKVQAKIELNSGTTQVATTEK